MIIRDGDVDIEKMRERLTPQKLDDARGAVDDVIVRLLPLTHLRAKGEPAHEVMRALSLVRNAIEDALDL
jgi:hypothetical protein